MTRKDYCQLQFGVILSCLICLSQAHTVLNSTYTRNNLNDTGFEDGDAAAFENPLQHAAVPAKEQNETSLLEDILNSCRPPTIKCLKKTTLHHVQEVLDNAEEIPVTSFMVLKKRHDAENFTYIFEEEDAANGTGRRSESFMETALEAFTNEATKFFINHNVELRIPKFLLEKANVSVPEVATDGKNAIVNLELFPRSQTDAGEPRIFFKKIKKGVHKHKHVIILIIEKLFKKGVLATIGIALLIIAKKIHKKLGIALAAIALVVALIKIILMFILPTIIGVASAKKFLLKVILFVFPFLTHIFKLCPYYPGHGGTKYHHHHHQISHIHNIPSLHHGSGIELDHPPPGYGHHGHHDDDLGYYSDGPGIGYEYGGHRKNGYKHNQNRLPPEENEIETWPKGQGQGQSTRYPGPKTPVINVNRHLTPVEIENLVLKAEKEALLKVRLQEEQKKVQAENMRLQEQLSLAKKVQEKLKLQAGLLGKGHMPHPQHSPHYGPDLPGNLQPSSNKFYPGPSPAGSQHVPQVLPQSLSLQQAQLLKAAHLVRQQHGKITPQALQQQLSTMQAPPPLTIPNQVFQPPFEKSSAVHQQTLVSNIANQVRAQNQNLVQHNTPPNSIPPALQSAVQQAFQKAIQQKALQAASNQQLPTPQTGGNQQIVATQSVAGGQTVGTSKYLSGNQLVANQQVSKNSGPSQLKTNGVVDPFYSPILEKIDKILNGLGYEDEGCRERLICSMYKNPTNYSPHSNLLSAELSRDSSELQKPTSSNSAVIRFYKYVQAARDGQDKRDCLRLYAACAVKTE